MSRLLGLTGILLIISHVIIAQSAPNQTDKQGRKQGVWVKTYPDGGPQYKGQFKDDIPQGTFERYYEDSTLQAIIVYKDKHRAHATLYYPGDQKIEMANGRYIDQKRDSIWTFYSQEGKITSQETYSHGLKQGLQTIYFENGAVSEKTNFENDVQNGPWFQYFPDGSPKLMAYVVNAVSYEGDFISYSPNGSMKEKGKYLDGKKESSWYEFNEDGSIHVIYVYRQDVIVEEHPKNGIFESYYPDDIKKDEFNYKDGLKNGPFKTYYHLGEWRTENVVDPLTGDSGLVQRFYGAQVEQEGKYLAGELHGEIITYNENGSVKSKQQYVKGVLQP